MMDIFSPYLIAYTIGDTFAMSFVGVGIFLIIKLELYK